MTRYANRFTKFEEEPICFCLRIDSGADFADLKLAAGDSMIDSVSVTLAQTLNTLSEKRREQFRVLGALPADHRNPIVPLSRLG